jgi:hypothetical protein
MSAPNPTSGSPSQNSRLDNYDLKVLSEKASRATRLSVIFLCIVISFSFAAAGFALYDRFGQTNERRTVQQEVNRKFAALNARLTYATVVNCREIESLKKERRDFAIENRKNLKRNAELLGVKLTPALIRQATADKFNVLKHYAPEPCPRRKKK